MKKFLVTATLFLVAVSVQAQQAQRERITQSDLHKVEKKQVKKGNDFSTWNKQQCEDYLQSLDAKEKAINADPKQREIALEEGWFADAEKNRKEVNERLKQLK